MRKAEEMKGCLLICSLTGELKLISETSACMCVCQCQWSGQKLCVCRHIGARVYMPVVCVRQGKTGRQADRVKQAEREERALLDFGLILFNKGQIFSNGYYCWVTYYLIRISYTLTAGSNSFLFPAEPNFLLEREEKEKELDLC